MTIFSCSFILLLTFSATVSEHTMLLEGTASRPPPGGSGPVTGAEIMRKLSKTHTHSDSALKIKVPFSSYLCSAVQLPEKV